MKNIRSLNWHRQLDEIENIDHIDGNFYIYENKAIRPVQYPFRIDMTVCCICLEGNACGRIDMRPYTIKAPAISITMPGQVMEHISSSSDFSGIFILMSSGFTGDLLPSDQATAFLSVRNRPVIELTQNQLASIMEYCSTVRRVINTRDNPNSMAIVRHLTIAFFYGLGYYFHKAQSANTEKKTREEILLQNFLEKVRIFHNRERRIDFYADQLHLTPKYLSRVIKNYSGKSAAEWIDDYVILTAKALLKSTDMTIQQISDELNFPSQSFFGKFFKRLTGVSPKTFRNEKYPSQYI